MSAITSTSPASLATQIYPALRDEIRVVVDTAIAAYHLNRRPQTLRTWACYEHGPIRPQRVHGKLAWSVADLRRLVGVSA